MNVLDFMVKQNAHYSQGELLWREIKLHAYYYSTLTCSDRPQMQNLVWPHILP